MPTIHQLGSVIATALASGAARGIPRGLAESLASDPESAAEVVRLFFAESRKKRANGKLTLAYSIMLEKALEAARWREENGSVSANDLIKTVRAAVFDEATKQKADMKTLLEVSRCFSAAKVDPGPEISRTIEASAVNEQAAAPADALREFEATCQKLAEDLGHDCFLIHEQVKDLVDSLPVEPRIALIAALAASPAPSLREAVAGFLLDRDASFANAIACILTQCASKGLVTWPTASRLTLLRNWLGDDRRPQIDAAIRAAQQKGIFAALRPAVQVNEILVSACDGAGAQSWFVIRRERRKAAIASLLNKHGFGLRDAWVRPQLTGPETNAFLAEIESEMCTFKSSLECVGMALEHGLAIALEKGEALPFGLLQFIEAAGIPAVTPRQHPPEDLLAQLTVDLPKDQRGETAISRALAQSKQWGKDFDWFDSWFEDSEAALARGATKKEKIANVLDEAIEHRRRYWGALLAWTAFGASAEDIEEIKDFVLVARELLGSRPLTEIPLAVLIAKNTVEAMQGR